MAVTKLSTYTVSRNLAARVQRGIGSKCSTRVMPSTRVTSSDVASIFLIWCTRFHFHRQRLVHIASATRCLQFNHRKELLLIETLSTATIACTPTAALARISLVCQHAQFGAPDSIPYLFVAVASSSISLQFISPARNCC